MRSTVRVAGRVARHPPRLVRHESLRGFTLIEVLVAVAVLAIAMAAVIGTAARMANNSAYLRDKTLAMLVAHNRVAKYQLQPNWPDTGDSDGEVTLAGQTWEWKAQISKTKAPSLRRVQVTVMKEDSDDSIASLNVFLSPPSKR